MTRPTYTDLRRTGAQDCANAFDVDSFDLRAGDADAAFDSFDWDGYYVDMWLPQQDDIAHLDPRKAYAAWLDGWRGCAVPRLELAIADARRARRNPAARAAMPAATKRGQAQKVATTVVRDAGFPKIHITCAEDVAAALTSLIGSRATEYFATIYVSARNAVLGYDVFTSGSPSGVEVNPQGIIANAIGVNAAGIITAHNHPSGSPDPSPQDRLLWSRLIAACDLMGIGLLDNMVITDNMRSYYSQREEGLLR